MRILYTFMLLASLSFSNLFAQEWLYTQQVSPITNAGVRGLTLDLDSNLYVTAFHRSNTGVTIFNGPYGSISYDVIGNAQDIIIAKLGHNGDTLWTKLIGGTGSDYPRQIVVDNNNDPYVAGVFRSPFMNIQDETLYNLTPATYDIFLSKYTADGANGFARKIAWGQDDQEVSQIAIDNLGNIYMVGSYVDSICFDTDTLTSTPVSDTSLFLAKFNSNGDLRWAKNIPIGGNSSNTTNFVEISLANNEEIYLGGFFRGTVSVDGISVTSRGTAEDILIMKVDSSGATQWMRMGGSNGTADRCNGITTSEDGFVYITGYFSGTAVLDSAGRGTLDSSPLTSAGGFDMLMAKYSPNGRLLWKKRNGSTGNDVAYGAKIRENILQFTGSFCGTVTFNNKTLSSGSITNPDAGFFVYDIDGNPITGQSVQGTLDDRGEYIEYGLKGNTYIGGYFKSPTLTVGTFTLNKQAARPAANSDGFVAKYHNPYSATFSRIINANCPGGNGGQLIVTTYFGTAPYTYDWSASTGTGTYNDSLATKLIAGYYQVSVTDARDSIVTIYTTITDPADFNIVLDSTNVSCYGFADGATNASATGGTGTKTYTWSGPGVSVPGNQNQSNLTAGLYKVTVTDAEGCHAHDSIIVNQPAPIFFGNVIVMPEDPKDSRTGSIDLNVSGGTSPYTYSWDLEGIPMAGRVYDTLNNLQDGNYTAHVSDDNTCTSDTTIFVPGDSLRVAMYKYNVKCHNETNGRAWAKIVSGDKGNPYVFSFTDNASNPLTPVNDTINNLAPGWYHVLAVEQGGDNRTAEASIFINEPDSIDLTLDPDTLNCFGDNNGTIGLIVNGGTPSFTYLWSDGDITQSATGLTAGWFKVTVTDANLCIAIDSAEVTQPDSLEIIINVDTAISCHNKKDGVLGAYVSGGSVPYSYLWDDNDLQTTQQAKGLFSRYYTVEVTDFNGCVNEFSATLNEPDSILLFSVDTANITCFGNSDGHIGLNLQGGTPPYSFDWTPAQSDSNYIDQLPVGFYQVITSDAFNCPGDTFSFEIKSQTSQLVLSENIAEHINNSCFGESTGQIQVYATGGWGGYTFSINALDWQPDSMFTNLQAATYTVTVRDSGDCEVEINSTITQPASQIIINSSVSGKDITAVAAGGTPPYSYSINGTTWQSTGTFTNLPAGTYHIQVTDNNDCGPIQSDALIVLSSISEADFENLAIYPNPSKGIFNLVLPAVSSDAIEIEIFSIQGVRIFTESFINNKEVKIDLTDIPQGIYMVKVNGISINSKLIKE